MKRVMAFLAMLLLLASAVHAESLMKDEYTDVSTAMTQDSVVELLASGENRIETLQPDDESMALLDDVYRYVWKDGNRPARYYDEATQQKIAALAGGIDIDILHMTEAMRMQLTGAPEQTVTATMRLDVDYREDQLVIVVLGIPQGSGEYRWFPYRGRVETTGEIKWDIPVEEWRELFHQPISFHVLTDRIGPRGEGLWHSKEEREHTEILSKDSGDVVNVHSWYTQNGEITEDDFRVWLVELTQAMQDEVARIGEHLNAGGMLLDWFPEQRRAEAVLMLPEDVDAAALIAYDIIALRDENYKDTYGDVNVEIAFGTAYDDRKAMVVLAGFPVEGAEEAPYLEWYVLRAEALPGTENDHAVEIGLKQLNLPRMEEEPMMLVVISEPLGD